MARTKQSRSSATKDKAALPKLKGHKAGPSGKVTRSTIKGPKKGAGGKGKSGKVQHYRQPGDVAHAKVKGLAPGEPQPRRTKDGFLFRKPRSHPGQRAKRFIKKLQMSVLPVSSMAGARRAFVGGLVRINALNMRVSRSAMATAQEAVEMIFHTIATDALLTTVARGQKTLSVGDLELAFMRYSRSGQGTNMVWQEYQSLNPDGTSLQLRALN